MSPTTMDRSQSLDGVWTRRRRLAGGLVAAGALAVALVGCGSSNDKAGESATTVAASTTAAATDAPIDNAITIDAPGMSYTVSGPLRPGIAAITFTNSDTTAHMMLMARLKDGVTLDQVTAALNQGEEQAAPLLADGMQKLYGTPAMISAGQHTTVTAVDLVPGTYAIACFVTNDDGMPHSMMGMIGEVMVTGDEATEEPESQGDIDLTDSAITLPDGFAGHGTFKVVNTGTEVHSISIAHLDEGTTLESYFQYVSQAEADGKTFDAGGGQIVGGVDGLAPGQSAYLTVDLPAGHYGYVSAADAGGSGMPAHGEFDVK